MDNLNLALALPETFLAIAICVILLVDASSKDSSRSLTYLLTLICVAVAGLLAVANFGNPTAYAYGGMYVSDPMGNLLKVFSSLAVMLTLVYSRGYADDRGMVGGSNLGGEFYLLSLFSLLGQFVMISGSNFLSIYIGLEMMSLSLYALVALRRGHAISTEAAMKYFVLGALASGFLLYGISMLYGASGTLSIPEFGAAVAAGNIERVVLVFGLVFVVAGLAFKLGAVPFHMWVPDVYQGAPTAVTLLLGGAPKLAAFAITMRLLVEGMLPMAFDWQQMLTVLAVLSIAIGNITAIVQTNIKRMLAYSTIAQVGFMLLGLLSGVSNGDASQAASAYSASLFYAATYVLTTLGTFGVIMLLARSGFEAEEIDDFKGLNQRSPWFAFVMLVLLFSLIGIPPMVGFYAKLAVLQSVLATGQVWLAVFAVLLSLVGAFYYLRVVKVMYFDDAVDTTAIAANADMRVTLSLNGAAVLLLGILPGPLMAVCAYAITRTLGT